ncbi:MAG: NFACT RNA binding domain-containing protein, partial [Parachlamydiaceae bacterium]
YKEISLITSKELEAAYLEKIAKREAEARELAVKKAREKIEKEIKRAEKWPEKMERAKLIQASLYSYDKKSHSLQLIGEEARLNLPRQMTPEKYLEKHLKEARRLKSQLESLKAKWENPLPEKKLNEERKPYLEFISQTGFKIWVGRSAKDNDTLTFKLARGSDLWLHVLHEKGAHVIVRAVKGKEIDRDTIKQAEKLALQYSKAKNKVLEVAKAYVKNLKKGKKPGEVIYSSIG